jgi:hypothetical protein
LTPLHRDLDDWTKPRLFSRARHQTPPPIQFAEIISIYVINSYVKLKIRSRAAPITSIALAAPIHQFIQTSLPDRTRSLPNGDFNLVDIDVAAEASPHLFARCTFEKQLQRLHYALEAGKEHNVPDSYVADPEENCAGNYLKLSAQPNGDFTVTNSRNGFSRTYNLGK